MSTGDPMIRAEALGLQFPNGTRALEGVGLELRAGEFASIVGPSGCGKSTLLRLVAGLVEPTAGTLEVGGQPARRREAALAFVFQTPNLLPWRTVRANVALPFELGPGARRPDAAAIGEALAFVGLADFAGAHPHQLSGGMQMRVSLARALVLRPRLMLMDEPFGALDEITRQTLNEEVLRLWARDRWSCLFVTHNVFEAVFLSQRVLVMGPRPGRVVREVAVPFAMPRDPALRTTPEFARVAGEVAAALRAAV
jgi:NitT/TauT family transport system ATP-binding protein